ncbi:hypothetical protein CEXT_465431, partial [Caerostris extrusa]
NQPLCCSRPTSINLSHNLLTSLGSALSYSHVKHFSMKHNLIAHLGPGDILSVPGCRSSLCRERHLTDGAPHLLSTSGRPSGIRAGRVLQHQNADSALSGRKPDNHAGIEVYALVKSPRSADQQQPNPETYTPVKFRLNSRIFR